MGENYRQSASNYSPRAYHSANGLWCFLIWEWYFGFICCRGGVELAFSFYLASHFPCAWPQGESSEAVRRGKNLPEPEFSQEMIAPLHPFGPFFINSNSPWGPFRAEPSGYMFPCKESRGAPSQGKVVSQGKWAPCSLQPSVPYWELTHAKNFLFASHLDLIVTLFSWHCCYFSPHIWENWDTEKLAPHHKAGREPTRRGQMSTVASSSPCMTPQKGPLLPGNWCHLAAERMWGDSPFWLGTWLDALSVVHVCTCLYMLYSVVDVSRSMWGGFTVDFFIIVPYRLHDITHSSVFHKTLKRIKGKKKRFRKGSYTE